MQARGKTIVGTRGPSARMSGTARSDSEERLSTHPRMPGRARDVWAPYSFRLSGFRMSRPRLYMYNYIYIYTHTYIHMFTPIYIYIYIYIHI